jgi:hypothetical protein
METNSHVGTWKIAPSNYYLKGCIFFKCQTCNAKTLFSWQLVINKMF